MKTTFCSLALIASLAWVHAAAATTWYVSPCGQDAWFGLQPNCAGPLGPKRTIQAAIDSASNGDMVLALPGTYFETIDFDGKEITVKGAAGAASTIIDGNGDGPVVLCNSFEGPGTTLQGFTIRDGFNDDTNGAGMVVALATVEILDCTFLHNETGQSESGGGLASLSGTVTVTNCQFIENTGGASAGGMLVWGGSATVDNCTFEDNIGYNRGGGMYIYQANVQVNDSDLRGGAVGWWDSSGGGLYIEEATVEMNNCNIDENISGRGPAGFAILNSDVTLTGCSISGNYIEQQVGAGAGIHTDASTVTLIGCALNGNLAGDSGGAIMAYDSVVSATLCGFHDNEAFSAAFPGDGGAGAAGYFINTEFQASACIFGNNSCGDNGGGAIVLASGSNVDLNGCTFQSNSTAGTGVGGAIRALTGTLSLDSCTFNANSAAFGGGVHIVGCTALIVDDCDFIGNHATAGSGGGVFAKNTSVTFLAGSFDDNDAGINGGGLSFEGTGANLILNAAQFSNNSATGAGGAISTLSNTKMRGCGFQGNSAHDAGALAVGGAFGHANLSNCLFNQNQAVGVGSAIMAGAFSAGSSVDMVNTIVSKNQCAFGGGAVHESALGASMHISNSAVVDNVGGGVIVANGATASVLANSIVWGNTSGAGVGGNMPVVRYCDVQGGIAIGTGSISANPKFVNAAVGNYHLGAGSPCIDAGNNWAVPQDSADLDVDLNLTELTPLDYDGNPRIANNAAAVDAGCGVIAMVDMGPFETAGAAIGNVKVGDVTGDGVVNVDDLLSVINAWGDCPGTCCPQDFDMNGVIDIDDLLVVISHWG